MYFDMTGQNIFDFKGKKNIDGIKTKKHNQRFTLVLAITSEEKFSPPVFIFKTKNQIKLENPYKSHSSIAMNSNGWQTSQLYEAYLSSVVNQMKKKDDQEIVLVHDKFSGHSNESINILCKKNNIQQYSLPAGSTGFIQPIDTNISKKLKSHMRDFQKLYIQEQIEQNQLEKGIKRATFQDSILWVLKSMKKFSKDETVGSFVFCGLTPNLDRSQDQHINNRITNKIIYSETINQYFLTIHTNFQGDTNKMRR